jgi:hypothetical protein
MLNVEAKQTKKASNPFDAVAKRNKKEKIAQPSAQDDPNHMETRGSGRLCSSGRQQCQHGGKESQHGTCSASGANAFLVNHSICIN